MSVYRVVISRLVHCCLSCVLLRFGSSLTCLALCEIIDRKDEFTSKTPHYVVQHEEWVITRFFFVNPSGQGNSTGDDIVKRAIEQGRLGFI